MVRRSFYLLKSLDPCRCLFLLVCPAGRSESDGRFRFSEAAKLLHTSREEDSTMTNGHGTVKDDKKETPKDAGQEKSGTETSDSK